jgi:hypothetical protein
VNQAHIRRLSGDYFFNPQDTPCDFCGRKIKGIYLNYLGQILSTSNHIADIEWKWVCKGCLDQIQEVINKLRTQKRIKVLTREYRSKHASPTFYPPENENREPVGVNMFFPVCINTSCHHNINHPSFTMRPGKCKYNCDKEDRECASRNCEDELPF